MSTVIAIDGPAGAGKSTVAKIIADSLSFSYIDSGALFRAITLKALEMNIKMDDIPSIINLAQSSTIDFLDNKIYLDGRDVSKEIRDNNVNLNVSYIAKIPEVRDIVADLQKVISLNKNVVVDGRDIGTTIFPDARIKFFMIASIEERARRRLLELNASGGAHNLDEMIKQISDRDTIDSNRSASPLKKAEDAIIVDTDNKNIEQVVAEMLNKIEKRLD